MKDLYRRISSSTVIAGVVVGILSLWSCNESPTAPIGSSWTTTALNPNFVLSSVAWTGKQFVVVGYSDTNGGENVNGIVLTSPNGVNWSKSFEVAGVGLTYVTWANNRLIAFGGSSIFTSTDGVAWSDTSTLYLLNSVTWTGKEFVAVGEDAITTSPDGKTWTYNGGSPDLFSVTWSGGSLVAVGQSEDSPTPVGQILSGKQGDSLTSGDGQNWGSQFIDSTNILICVTWTGKQFVAVGGNIAPDSTVFPTILTSSDGIAWTSQKASTPGFLRQVIWTGSQFVALEENYSPLPNEAISTNLLTSPDGINWTPENFGSQYAINSITWNGSELLAVGFQGTVLISQ